MSMEARSKADSNIVLCPTTVYSSYAMNICKICMYNDINYQISTPPSYVH